ncbi:MAG: hypothetical protein HOP24_05405 [Sideroxydans sp.]|nr:hypothetical protein [Sideroxydans sp.]
MNNFRLIVAASCVAALAAGCGGGSKTSAAPAASGIPTAAVKITAANASTVAKGAVNSSQAAVNQSGQASAVGAMVTSSSNRRSVKDIALMNFARARNAKLSPSVLGAVTNVPATACATSGTVSMSMNDVNGDGTMGNGDSLTINFAACSDGATVENGSLTFAITSLSGQMGTAGTPGAPLTASFKMTFVNFSSTDVATNAKDSMNGDITFATSDDGDTTTGTMSGTSLTTVSSIDGTSQMSNYSISFSDTISTSGYGFGIGMTTADAAMGGSVTIATPTQFTGTGAGDPTAGVMTITGAGGSTLTLTAQADGTTVTQVVDEDGAAGSIAPVTLASTTWAAL